METNNTTPNNPTPILSNNLMVPSNPHHGKEYLLIAIAVIVLAAGAIWWQLGKQIDEIQISEPIITPNPETREVASINNDVNNLEMGNLDNEFQQIDKALNSL